MTPILFDGNSKEFNSNGLGRLSDCTSCLVTEERNGIYECEFVYPIIGAHYKDIDLGKIIVVTHDDRRDKQPFIIYRRSAPISGMVVFNAHHVSYLLSNVIIRPFSATTVSGTFTGFKTNAITENPFTFWTNKSSSGTFSMSVPSSCRSLLAGREGSVLDSFGGGDYEFDGYAVKLYANRGNDSGVTIRYGKNMTDLSAETDTMSLYTAVVPYWVSGDESVYGGVVYGNGAIRRSAYWTDENGAFITDENGEQIEFQYDEHKVVTMDLSSYFETAPTAEQLESRAQVILNANRPWIPTTHIKVDFVSLWQTEEYKNIAPLERVRLCDTVTVKYAELGVDVKARVIKTVWNPLLDRYDSIEIGDEQMSFADTIAAETDMKLADIPNTSMMQKAIDHATDLITGGLGGNIVFTLNGDGKPIEQLIMDTLDKATAVNVWRWNLGGLGHSHSGYNGPFDDIAITQDGRINASMITVGTLNANVIAANSIAVSKLTGSISNGNWKLDLDAGTFTIGNMSADNITTGTLNVARIAANSVPVGKLSGSITNNNWEINLTSGTLTIGDISANNIVSGTLTLGGSGTKANGKLEVKDASDNTLCTFSKSGITINSGTFTTVSGNLKTIIGNGLSDYYYNNYQVGTIGANIANGEEGLIFDLKPEGDYIGWFLNGVNYPLLIYDKSDWLSKDVWSDTLTACCDVHISNLYALCESKIADPTWRFDGVNAPGYTGNVTVNGVRMTFKSGVLTNAANV